MNASLILPPLLTELCVAAAAYGADELRYFPETPEGVVHFLSRGKLLHQEHVVAAPARTALQAVQLAAGAEYPCSAQVGGTGDELRFVLSSGQFELGVALRCRNIQLSSAADLPVSSGSFRAQRDLDAVPSGNVTPPVVAGEGLLIVEDDPDQRKILEMMLRAENFKLRMAKNGAEALAEIERVAPQAVVTDLMMPVMGGRELLQRLRADARFARMPVMILTVLDDDASEVELLAAGANQYCDKTVAPKVLVQRIRRLLPNS